MLIPLTIVGEAGSADVVLPDAVPVAVLSGQLSELTRLPNAPLATLDGRPLNPSLDLLDNGVRPGAMLLARLQSADDQQADDVAELAAQPSDPDPRHTSAGLAAGVGVLAGSAAYIGSRAPIAVASLIAIMALALLPRVVLWAGRLTPDSDPRDEAVLIRIRRARRAIGASGIALTLIAAVGGAALAHDGNLVSIAAGWMLLIAMCFRAAASDHAFSDDPKSCPILTHALAAAVAIAGFGVFHSSTLATVTSIGGLVCACAALCIEPRRPAARVARQFGQLIIAVALPVTLLAATGLIPQ